MTINLKIPLNRVTDLFLIILGTAMAGFAVGCFLAPNNIVSGGVTGIAIIICSFFPLSLGFVTLVINIPIFIIGVLKLGKKVGVQTLLGTLLLSLFIEVFEKIGAVTNDILLSALFGGVISGIGFGLVFYAGATTGGIDIIAKIIAEKRRHISLGKIIFMLDIAVITAAVFVFKNVDITLYSVISFFAASVVTDLILEGFNFAKLVFVISDKSSEITRIIGRELNRGVTYLHGNGAYTGKFKKIILCTIRNKEIPVFKDIVQSVDETAFMLITDAREVLGEGFKCR